MKRILILGASGLLGNRMGIFLKEFYGTFFETKPHGNGKYYYFDVCHPNQFKDLINLINPDLVFNCTGFTNVERCEILPEKCWNINCSSIVNIAEICRVNSVKFVHISTDHFTHHQHFAMREEDNVDTPNQYSFSKLNAERMITEVNPKSLIIRTNFFQIDLKRPRTYLERLIISVASGTSMSSFRDVLFTPISINQLIKSSIDLVNKEVFGTINISSNESVSKYDFHRMVLNSLDLDTGLLKAVSIDDFPHLVKRPKNMSLDNAKLRGISDLKIPSIYDMIIEEISFNH